MKRWISGIFAAVLLCCCGCAEETTEEKAKMDDLMKISTWVMDPTLEGKGYWEYTGHATQGTWVPNEGESAVNDKEREFDRIKAQKAKASCRSGREPSEGLDG